MNQSPNPSPVASGELDHEQTLAWIARHRAWRKARKTRPIWAREVEPAEIGKPFQTADRAVQHAEAGYWLCVGVAQEPWFQKRSKIDEKYDAAGTLSTRFPFEEQEHEYTRFEPKPDKLHWAAQIVDPQVTGFSIRPSYQRDRPLHSPAGGYVVRPYVENPYASAPDDVWLVQQQLFESTYEFVDDSAAT